MSEVVERMSVEGVWLAYGDRWVVRDVSLPIRKGEVLALIGASGSGKTTLLRSLNRLTEITAEAARAGRITLDGEEISEIEVNSLRRRVSMVFQQPNPFPMSIFENVAYALREEHPQGGRRKRHSRSELEPMVIDALRRAGLYEEVAGNLDHPALRLSGGQQQRSCIARALAVRPEVLLLDEPCSALDPISTATIEKLIVGLRESVAIVIVTHNLQQAMRVATTWRSCTWASWWSMDRAHRCSTVHAKSAPASTWAARSGEFFLMKVAYGSFLGTVAAISLVLVSSGCQTTAEKSAELRKLQKHEVLAVTGVSVKSENPSVKVLYSAVVGSQEGATAIVVGMRNTSSHALRLAPIEVTAKDAKGSVVYQNTGPGLQPSLTSVSLLEPGRDTVWVDDQVQATGVARTATALVGAAKVASTIPKLTVSGAQLSEEAGSQVDRGASPMHRRSASGISSYTQWQERARRSWRPVARCCRKSSRARRFPFRSTS